jgi:hypothetical protein
MSNSLSAHSFELAGMGTFEPEPIELKSEAQSKADFWKEMEELEREVARFEASVDAFCEAVREFKANL